MHYGTMALFPDEHLASDTSTIKNSQCIRNQEAKKQVMVNTQPFNTRAYRKSEVGWWDQLVW